MKLKMSFFDPALLRKNISRFAPAWAMLLVIQFLAGPNALIRELNIYSSRDWNYERATDYLSGMTELLGPMFSFCAALIFAGLLFKYLHKTRAAYMMHAFPMTRDCMLVTNLVSGLLFWLIPSLVITVIDLLIMISYHVPNCVGPVFAMLGKWTLQYLCFYGIAVFSMMIAGSTTIAVISYGALNFLFMLLPVLFLSMTSIFTRGLDINLEESLGRLAPIVGMIMEYDLCDEKKHPALLWIYAAVGLFLLILAWIHYRHRHVERAGDSMAYGWARFAFRVIFTICLSLGMGLIWVGIDGEPAFIPYALLGCFLGWFACSMMIERTVKVFRKKKVWLGFGISAALLLLTVFGLYYDLLGFQRRIPKQERVEYVEIWSDCSSWYRRPSDRITLTDPADIASILSVHRQILDDGESWGSLSNLFYGYVYPDGIHISYQLTGGDTLNRYYPSIPEDASAALDALYARPDICAARYAALIPERITDATLRYQQLVPVEDLPVDPENPGAYSVYYDPDEGKEYYEYTGFLYCRNLNALRGAILADAAAGRLPLDRWHDIYYSYYDYEKYSGEEGRILELRLTDPNGNPDYLELMIPNTATKTLALFAEP